MKRDLDILLDDTPLAVFALTVDGLVSAWNRAAEEMFGWSAGEAIGRSLTMLVRGNQRDLERLRAMALAGEKVRGAELVRKRRDGREIVVRASCNVRFDERGAAVGFLCTAEDVTEQRRLEVAVQQIHSRYERLLERIPDVLWTVAEEGITFISPSVEPMWGYTPDEVYDRGRRLWYNSLHADDRDRVLACYTELFDFGKAYETDYRLRHAKGHWIWVRERAVLATEPDGSSLAYGALIDITDRKEIEAQLAQSRRVETLGHLAASVAHEFNNVLMSILPFARLLEQRLAGTEVESWAMRIAEAVQRGRHVSQDILRFARPIDPVLMPLEVEPWLRGVINADASAAGLDITIAASEPGLAALADKEALAQVIVNLLLNAREAMPHGGAVRIEIRATADVTIAGGDCVEINVTDSGSGIAPNILPHLFDPLFTTKRGGTGLGLAVAHRAMQLQGGHIKATSDSGTGATFTLLLPRATKPAVASSEAPPSAPSRLRAVVVDDEKPIADGLSALLEVGGAVVVTLYAGGEVVDTVARFGADVVILDLLLPDVDGYTVYTRLRERWPDLPIIFSTGHTETLEAEPVGPTRLLTKPYEMEALTRALAELCGERKMMNV